MEEISSPFNSPYNLIDFDKHDLKKISMNFYNGAVGSRLKHVFDVKNSICDLLISDILQKVWHPKSLIHLYLRRRFGIWGTVLTQVDHYLPEKKTPKVMS